MKFSNKNMNKKYSLRVLLEGLVEFGNMTFSIDTNSKVAKAIRVEGNGESFANANIDDYIDDAGQPITSKRNELGNIIMLDMIRRGVQGNMGYYGSERARNPSIAAGGMMEELVRASFPNATSLNILSFSNNEPFADVAVPFGTGNGIEYISVKFSRDEGSSTLKKAQVDYLRNSLENKGTKLYQRDRLSAIEIALDGDNFVISKVGPTKPKEFKQTAFDGDTSGVSAAQERLGDTESRKTINMPPETFFVKLKEKAPTFITGIDLAQQTSRPTSNGGVPEAQRTSSGAYSHIGDNLAAKVAGFVTRTGDKGRDTIKAANAIQKLLVKALASLEADNAEVDEKKVEELRARLVAAYNNIDLADGADTANDINLAEVKNKRMDSKMKEYRIKRKDLILVVEAIKYIHSDSVGRRLMREACGDKYPDEHVDPDGRMMDYGHTKSDSHEGRMTKAKLFRMAQMAQRLHDKLVDGDDLPGWVADKVTTAEDRLMAAHNYILYKIHRLENR